VIGCLSDCSSNDPKWNCIGGDSVSWTDCSPTCGDSLVAGNEFCDDGVALGCLADCSGPTPGFICETATNICSPICGDGRVYSPETCDDGPSTHLIPYKVTGRLSTCLAPAKGWACTGGDSSTPTSCMSVCGDFLKVGPEICDDGDTSNDSMCDS